MNNPTRLRALAGLVGLTLTFLAVPAQADTQPYAFTAPVATVTFTNGVLTGAATPNAVGTAGAYFQWGTDLTYGQTTTPQPVTGSNLVWLRASLSGLVPNQIYHYRLVVTNQAGIALGGDRQFLTGGRLYVDAPADVNFIASQAPIGPVVDVAADVYNGLARFTDGTVVGWGPADSLGTLPTDLTNILAMAIDASQGVVARNDGTVEAWGLNNYGQLAVPAAATNAVAVATMNGTLFALRQDGTIVQWGNVGTTVVPPGISNVVAIAHQDYELAALFNDGTVATWGHGYGVLPEVAAPTNLTHIVALAGGAEHTLALRDDGTVLAWGYNDFGQCSVPSDVTNVVAVAGGTEQSMALRADGTMIMWGSISRTQTVPPIAAMAGGGGPGNTIPPSSFSIFVQADRPPVPTVQTNFLYDQFGRFEVGLAGTDPDGDPLTFFITALPRLGILYQYAAGAPGAPITAVPAPVSDPTGKIIYIPPAGARGSPYDTYAFAASDGEINSLAPATNVINVIPPTANPQTASAYDS